MSIERFVEKVLHSRDQVHIWHLQTTGYAEHKALNEYYDQILELFDTFVETYMGAYNVRFKVNDLKPFLFENHNPVKITKHFSDIENYFSTEGRGFITGNRDLNNIMDEMLGLVNKINYLLTLT